MVHMISNLSNLSKRERGGGRREVGTGKDGRKRRLKKKGEGGGGGGPGKDVFSAFRKSSVAVRIAFLHFYIFTFLHFWRFGLRFVSFSPIQSASCGHAAPPRNPHVGILRRLGTYDNAISTWNHAGIMPESSMDSRGHRWKFGCMIGISHLQITALVAMQLTQTGDEGETNTM